MNNILSWLKHLETDKRLRNGSYKNVSENILLQITDHTPYDSCRRSQLCGVGCAEWGKRAVSAGNTASLADCCRVLLSFVVLLRLRPGSSQIISSLFIVRQWLGFGRSAVIAEGQLLSPLSTRGLLDLSTRLLSPSQLFATSEIAPLVCLLVGWPQHDRRYVSERERWHRHSTNNNMSRKTPTTSSAGCRWGE